MVPATSHAGTTLLVHAAAPAEFTILVFGNGHVGRAVVQVLGTLPAHVRWIDGREHDFPAGVPNNVEVVTTDAPGDELADARPRKKRWFGPPAPAPPPATHRRDSVPVFRRLATWTRCCR